MTGLCDGPDIAIVNANDVVTTIADGKIVMEDRLLHGVDEAKIRAKFREKALALRDRSL